MKKLPLLLTLTALLANLSAQQKEQAGYTGFLTQALEAIENNNEQEFTTNMKYFSTAIEENNITPEILTEENYKLYSKCLYQAAVREYKIGNIQQAKEFIAYDTGNYPDNLFLLGFLYYLEQDYTKAMEWLEKSADKGETTAMNNLGVMYGKGQGVEQNYTKAEEWYKKAAYNGNVLAMNNLTKLYYWGETRDYTKAKKWFEKLAEIGDIDAMRSLGTIYESGIDVKRDYAKAREWYEKAAERGDGSAMNNLGRMYQKGLGVKRDKAKAKEWYKKACDADHPFGCQNYEALNK